MNNQENIKKFINEKKYLLPFNKIHSYITQYDNVLDTDNELNIDFFIRFENLNEDLCDVLLKLGINKITHLDKLFFNTKINSSKDDNYSNYYDEEILNFVNTIYFKDFEVFNFKKVINVKELMEDSLNYYKTNEEFNNQNTGLLTKIAINNDYNEHNEYNEYENELIKNYNLNI